MTRTILFFSLLFFMFTPVLVTADDVGSDQSAGETGTEEVMITTPVAETVHAFTDDRVVAIKKEAQENIQAVLEEIDQLADKSDEGELQKKIERIKMNAEIARFKIYMEDAEDAQDFDRVSEISDEINHLENLDKPTIGVPEQQPVPKAKNDKKKGGKGNG